MFLDKLANVEKRFIELESSLSRPDIINDRELFSNYSKELSELREVVEKYREYTELMKSLAEAEAMLKDESMKELAEEEIKELERKKTSLISQLEVLLIPKDPLDDKNIIMEIRAGTGGDEAALFAGDLLRMYLRYAERKGWKTEIIDASDTGLGGYKEAIVNIIGKGAYSRLKYEGGIHRVQRVPKTEASGRIHTSAASVAILPEVEDVDIHIDEKDIKFEAFRAGGAGGQNVNKVSSAVRVTHLPTGTVVECREERSQLQNRAKAMKLLRARIYEAEEEKLRKERESSRRVMVGSGDRSEKIRTYNFPQSRITDHRIGFTVHQLNSMLDGDIDELIDALATADRAAKLANAA
ncbi:peptide chain release factor 1 [candidate division WOR-1 bacterium RIFOXYA12_FULL_52_29]|uniref:Peptide chain release factor 1 n=1 Tax=candidate division WOR-1 bacterium RIFOXYC12_FULL_54_18 TaxID=1802584 RepID=A0A1F4T7W7_UNCSA|nr:MAG: peptide chain release factor 1 [candidate division WOR-1 bacterium RIFOXYA2_FULL_51_19]OGC18398.1 MAG: peptide chain release factor 1 [candidate division WOR-1 bacterium RIFOXYA12_FULL_52_29]OGC27253.1 MAG: peptide chain release factor 1 [candidate division WOR-1 bacterium RIFOXYB2_FULL_45_9]OGC28815.1 MAG: peptide chain release factor 1 [candidate division WOR-1 bacterium RIFOXYC12_FULL_54_18]OGC30731.1 MAG: peptide chain release factor 1 [candidate division WOR-1 bacterium RIFOXYB12_F